MKAWSPELELVARLARLEPTPDDEAWARALAARSPNWDRVLRLAVHHGVAPLVDVALSHVAVASVPQGFREQLHGMRLSSVRADLAMYHCWRELCGAFEAAAIPALTLKGFPVVLSVYGQVGLRPVEDLDFLVRPEDVSRALALLGARGYHLWPVWQAALRNVGLPHILEHKGEIGLASDRGVVVDLHWEAIPRRAAPPTDELMRGAERLRVDDQDVLVPAADAAFVLLLLHGHKSAWARLRWLVDVAERMEKQSPVEYDRARHQLEALGTPSALANALWLIESLWGRLPARGGDFAQYERAVHSGALRHAQAVMERDRNWENVDDSWRPMRMLWDLVGRFRSPAAAVASAARPGPLDWASVSLPNRLRAGYYVVRPMRVAMDLLARAGRAAKRGGPPAAEPGPPAPTPRVWQAHEAVPLTFVTAIYDSGPSSLLGGRGRDISYYLPSLINIANLGAPIVVHCSRADVGAIEAAIAPYFRDHRVVAYELSAFEHFDAFLAWKRTYLHDLPINDRNEVLCFLKSYWVEQAAADNAFGHDRYFWIDAGLTHHGIFPERIGGVELLVNRPASHYYPRNPANIFTPQLGAALGRALTPGRLFFCALPYVGGDDTRTAYERIAAATFDVPRDGVRIDDHLGGGLFGGDREDLRAVHRLYVELLEQFIETRTYTREEQVFSSLNAVHPELFSLHRFGTWYFHAPGERTSRLQAEGESFYKIFARLATRIATP